MNKQFGTDKYWKGNKESGVYFNVAQKGESAGTAGRRGEHREYQQWQPYEQCDDDYSAPQELQVIPFQVGSSKELEDRATQHQREIMLSLAEVVLWRCVQVLFSAQHLDPLSINISFSRFDRSVES
jgi:hypothetical protein